MLSIISYYRLMTAFFAYSAMITGLLTTIFALLALIMSTQRWFLFLLTLAELADIFAASLASYVTSSMLIDTNLFPSYSEAGLVFYAVFILPPSLVYMSMRILYFYENGVPHGMWYKGSNCTRTCYITQFFFPGAIVLLLLLHCLFVVGWIL